MEGLLSFVARHSNGTAKKTKGMHGLTKTRCNGQNCVLALISRFIRLEHKLFQEASGGEQEAVDDGASI